MRNKLLILLAIYSLMGIDISYAAEDDVYIDLSVLDNIPRDSIGFIKSQPLFPEIKKTEQIKPVVKKKTTSVKSKTDVKKKINVVKPQSRKPQPPVSKEKEVRKQELFENLEVREKEQEEKPILEIIAPVDQPEPKVHHEPESILPQQVSSIEDTLSQTENKPEENKDISEKETIGNNQETILSAKLETLVEQQEKISDFAPREVYFVSFAPDTAELSPEALQKLEKMSETFSPDRKKKIAIRSYNYENGESSLHKKRISLNRATEIRSFFLGKGFKNFNIKIVNTTADNEYKDTVEIEELN